MGREFVDMFEDWADSYDDTVNNRDNEYHEVFENYDLILTKVADRAKGRTLEFGVGTGNLTEKLRERGHEIYGIEPSKAMREKAGRRFPEMKLVDGDFLQYPEFEHPVETIVSTYAFHHLTDDEKRLAIHRYSERLPKGGRIVFADTLFENEEAKKAILSRVEEQGYDNLLYDLQTEYYPFLDTLKEMFTANGFSVNFKRLNRYVFLIEAVKI
ncbi:MAG TPA: class I SAM-dependent methyltransferase [Bacillales bacterium]|nr:class I SAM-dependent methyltransferase [Bacillales bacterium]